MLELVPAEVIAGEAAICSIQAMLAVAWIYQRNQRFNGWHPKPSITAQWVAANWQRLPDTSNGATFLFSKADLGLLEVQRLIAGRPLLAQFECKYGLGLYAF